MPKVAMIGIDAAIPSLVQKYFKAGRLPNMYRLASAGTWSEAIPAFPTHTASNWNTVSTGAWPKTHGVTDMVVHIPGTPLTEIRSGFYSDLCKAEQIWRTADRSGKKSILVKYIGSWPPIVGEGDSKNLMQIEGFGAPGGPGSRPWGSSPLAIANSSCHYSSGPKLENAARVSLASADLAAWKHLPNAAIAQRTMSPSSGSLSLSACPPLETEVRIGPAGNAVTYNVLLLALRTEGNGGEYDTAIIAKGRDAGAGFTLCRGQLTNWIVEDFQVGGKAVKASFRMKLMDIGRAAAEGEEGVRGGNGGGNSSGGEGARFKLFATQVFPLEGWAYPDGIAKDLVNRFGPFLESISHFPYVFGWIDEDSYLEDAAYQAKWMGNATGHLMSKHEWDLYMTQWHGVDNTQHAFLRFDKSVLTPQEAEMGDRVVLRSYEIADELVGDIYRSYASNGGNGAQDGGKDVYTFVVSDHGHVMGKRRFFINSYLYQKGLIKLKRDESTGRVAIDWANTQAYAQGMVHLYVNLKGRDPQGSVSPGRDYEIVIGRLLDILYDIKDPKTNLRPINLALRNGDAEFLGLSGGMAGDIVFAANPIYAIDNRVRVTEPLFEDLKTGLRDGSIHGQQLPSVDMGEYGMIKSMFIAHGPNIRKGYVREKPISLVDIAPTIAHILGIERPRDCEGAVLHDIFE